MKIILAFLIGLIAAPLLIVLAAIAGLLPSNASSDPPKWESAIGMRAVDQSLDRRSAGLKNPIALNDPVTVAAGAKIYGDNCAECHGDSKGPSSWGATGLYPRAPQFFEEGSDVTPAEAFVAIHDGIRYSGMGAWHDQLSDDEIWKVANFVTNIHGKHAMMADQD